MLYGSVQGLDKPVSRLVQGTVMVRSDAWESSVELLDAVFAQGCNTFDTAHVYGQGDNERTFGRWVNERGIREQVVIIGKGAHHNQDRQRVTPYDITADIHDSLARLRTDYIDLYVLHRDNPKAPVAEIVEVLNMHMLAGRIRAFGGSNWSHQRIQEANAYALKNDLVPFAVSSPHFSLAIQYKEPWDNCISLTGEQGADARAFYRDTQMPLFTWSSLAGGFFSGRFRPDNLDTFTAYLDKLCVQSYCYDENFARYRRAEELAAAKGVSVPQLALAYVHNQPWNVFTLVGCANGGEFAVNAAALDVTLTEQELAWLETGA
jgi:aryl-alcohol dehydrogenase-like predicted oxidoreductase